MLDTSRPQSNKPSGRKIQPVEHPLVKISKDNLMEMSVNPISVSFEEGRSVAFEDEDRYKVKKKNVSSRSFSSRSFKQDSVLDSINPQSVFLTNIPESIAVIEGDTNATRLPIFGNRSAVQSRGQIHSRQGSSKSTETISAEEISERFQKKLSANYYEVRKKFIDNDPDRNGNVHREALMRIIQVIIGCELTTRSLNSLLELWGFKTDKQMFSFTEINTIFVNKSKSKSEVNFIDPVGRPKPKSIVPSKMMAVDVFELLKEKFRSRSLYLSDLFPNSVESQTFQISKTDLKNALYKIMIDLLPAEMDKLWLKFDPTKQNSVDCFKFLKQMGIISQPVSSLTPRIKASTDASKPDESRNSFETLLKTKLREGCKALGKDFQKKDTKQNGFVSEADFIQVLADHNLNLDENYLNEFLARCIVYPTKEGIPYNDFLVRFQDRSEAGITHNLLTYKDKKKNGKTDQSQNPLNLIEMKLVNLFQKDFLELLENFRTSDKYENGSIEISDFKRILEKQMNTTFTESQFKAIVDNLPLNRRNCVLYLDFLKQFDSGTFSPLSFNSEQKDLVEYEKPESSMDLNFADEVSDKSLNYIKSIVKNLFDTRYAELEKTFNELDEYNNKVLTQETMYQLMKSLNVKPELTRGDIRSLWKIFFLNERKLLDFKEFTRHFMYNKLTASFPNAKLYPPVKGDSDLMLKSKTLTTVTDILLNNLRSKIDIMYNDLKMEFTEMDKENTGEVSVEDFKEILKELCIHLTDHEIQTICEKFKTDNNKISYTELLKPFGTHKQLQSKDQKCEEKQSKKPTKILAHSKEKNLSKDFHQKLQILNQPSLKRSLKKIDFLNNGLIQTTELRNLLMQEGICLSEEEVYHLLNNYDKNLNGSINYKLLLQDLRFSD